jgi:hypothetical protein
MFSQNQIKALSLWPTMVILLYIASIRQFVYLSGSISNVDIYSCSQAIVSFVLDMDLSSGSLSMVAEEV